MRSSTIPVMELELTPFDLNDAITLTEAAGRIRSFDKSRIHVNVALRWATHGYRPRGWQGSRLILPTVVLGRLRWLMPQWLQAFEAERVKMGLAVAIRPGLVKLPRTPSETRIQKDRQRATMRLKKEGLMK